MWQQYTLGKLLRERYINPPTPFLSTIYNAKEVKHSFNNREFECILLGS
jgi:hypothetical protein